LADIIVAGNTSGSITISAPLVAGSGTLTLPTGTDTLIGKATTDTLTNKSIAATQLTGTIAAAAMPAGSVIQVVQGTTTTATSTAAGPVDTTLTASITPRSASNKILVITTQNYYLNGGGQDVGVSFSLLRGASVIVGPGSSASVYMNATGSTAETIATYPISYLDSPATTSSTTYKTQMTAGNGATCIVQNGNATSTITLMEIAV
jgi:hypothetical protein